MKETMLVKKVSESAIKQNNERDKVECYTCLFDTKYNVEETIITVEGYHICEECFEKGEYLGICSDCGRPFHEGYIGLGYEGNADGVSLCCRCEGENFYICKSCGEEADYCLMRVGKTEEDCPIYQNGQALIEEAAREKYEEEKYL